MFELEELLRRLNEQRERKQVRGIEKLFMLCKSSALNTSTVIIYRIMKQNLISIFY